MIVNELEECSISARIRKIQLKEIYEFINSANILECAQIIEEILSVHKNLIIFSPKRDGMEKIESICINEEFIQMNLEENE